MQPHDTLFVVFDPANRLHVAGQCSPLRSGCSNADRLRRYGVDAHCAGRSSVAGVVGINGNVVHAHLVCRGYRGRNGRIHRITVKQGLVRDRAVAYFRRFFATGAKPVADGCADEQRGQNCRYRVLIHRVSPCQRLRPGPPGTAWRC